MQSALDGKLEERLLTTAREFSKAGMAPLDIALEMVRATTGGPYTVTDSTDASTRCSWRHGTQSLKPRRSKPSRCRRQQERLTTELAA
jgi:hypothetical protein